MNLFQKFVLHPLFSRAMLIARSYLIWIKSMHKSLQASIEIYVF